MRIEPCAKHGCYKMPLPGTIYCFDHHYPECPIVKLPPQVSSDDGRECECDRIELQEKL